MIYGMNTFFPFKITEFKTTPILPERSSLPFQISETCSIEKSRDGETGFSDTQFLYFLFPVYVVFYSNSIQNLTEFLNSFISSIFWPDAWDINKPVCFLVNTKQLKRNILHEKNKMFFYVNYRFFSVSDKSTIWNTTAEFRPFHWQPDRTIRIGKGHPVLYAIFRSCILTYRSLLKHVANWNS